MSRSKPKIWLPGSLIEIRFENQPIHFCEGVAEVLGGTVEITDMLLAQSVYTRVKASSSRKDTLGKTWVNIFTEDLSGVLLDGTLNAFVLSGAIALRQNGLRDYSASLILSIKDASDKYQFNLIKATPAVLE